MPRYNSKYGKTKTPRRWSCGMYWSKKGKTKLEILQRLNEEALLEARTEAENEGGRGIPGN